MAHNRKDGALGWLGWQWHLLKYRLRNFWAKDAG